MRHALIELSTMLILLVLWGVALFRDSLWVLLIAIAGSAVTLVILCRHAMKE